MCLVEGGYQVRLLSTWMCCEPEAQRGPQGRPRALWAFLRRCLMPLRKQEVLSFRRAHFIGSLMSQHCSAKETETKYSRWFETVSGIPEGYEISSFIADDKSEDIGHFAQLITLTGLPETDSWKSISFIIEKHQNKRPRRRCWQQWGGAAPGAPEQPRQALPEAAGVGASAGRAALQVPLLAWSLIKWILKCRI